MNQALFEILIVDIRSYARRIKHCGNSRLHRDMAMAPEFDMLAPMLFPKRTTWFFIADGAKAFVYESEGAKSGWALKGEWRDEAARAPDRELARDRPTRGRTIATGEPFAIEGGSQHDKAEESFLLARAEALNEAARTERFDQLALAAPPAALGRIRKKLSADVTARLITVLDKDLTNMPEQELHAYFIDKLEHW